MTSGSIDGPNQRLTVDTRRHVLLEIARRLTRWQTAQALSLTRRVIPWILVLDHRPSVLAACNGLLQRALTRPLSSPVRAPARMPTGGCYLTYHPQCLKQRWWRQLAHLTSAMRTAIMENTILTLIIFFAALAAYVAWRCIPKTEQGEISQHLPSRAVFLEKHLQRVTGSKTDDHCCIICRDECVLPVRTEACGHVTCESCAS